MKKDNWNFQLHLVDATVASALLATTVITFVKEGALFVMASGIFAALLFACAYNCFARAKKTHNRPFVVTLIIMSAVWAVSGQCSITAFLIQDIFGGEVYGIKRPDGNFHCYNVIDGKQYDLTIEQFGDEAKSLVYDNTNPQLREVHFRKEEKYNRYLLLKSLLKGVRGA